MPVADALGMDLSSPQVLVLWVVGALVIGWVLYSLVGQLVAAVVAAKQDRAQAAARRRWGAHDVPAFAQSRPRPPAAHPSQATGPDGCLSREEGTGMP